MSETATSPRHRHHHHHTTTRSSRPTTTPAARPPSYIPGSVGQAMPPLLSPRNARTPNQPITTNPKTPSPNYFGCQSNEDVSFLAGSPQNANKTNFSPPSSAVRSTAATSPSLVPLDQNPDFDAFRRQSEGKAFNLGGIGGSFGKGLSMPVPSAPSMSSAMRPTATHRRTSSSRKVAEQMKLAEQMREAAQTAHRKSLDPSTAELGRSPKRVLSPGSMILPEEGRRASPASFAHSESPERGVKDATADMQPRFALPLDKAPGSAVVEMPTMHKAESLPLPETSGREDAPLIVTAQHVVNLLESRMEQVLMLDLRVQTQYAKSHIGGALSLCIPTTLLKRPSFNVQKLAEAFKDEGQRHKFERWRSSSYIIVYDASSALLKDATICLNTIKKFRSEGYKGTLYIVKGGFAEFSRRFPAYVDESLDSDASDSSRPGEGPDAIPVMGGCPMPSTDKPANPFFGNIRQNMDLIGGVGQIPLQIPSKASRSGEQDFPSWLRSAADPSDKGARVAHKYEQIERREKKRMEDALSTKVSWTGNTPTKPSAPGTPIIRLAGLEKGSKNRYNNIWPYEHTRVKLQSIPAFGCDYVNASFVQAAGCAKKYISTQAPIPATFVDFWSVVWQQDIRVIVMLTAEKEGAQVKAHNYWSGRQYGPLRVEFISEKRASIEPDRIRRHRASRPSMGGKRHSTSSTSNSSHSESSPVAPKHDEPFVLVRRFTLTHEKFPFAPIREVTQLQYASWPDFGAPAHPAHVLGLVEQCDNVVRSASSSFSGEMGMREGVARPVLVHCSAGCGRTGTFCTVDSVIDTLKRRRRRQRQQQDAKTNSASATTPTRATPFSRGTPMEVDTPLSMKATSAQKSKKIEDGGDFFSVPSTSAAVDDARSLLDADDDIDLVEKFVEDFRHQRLSMVQSLRQYVLCYESVMEWIVGEGRVGT